YIKTRMNVTNYIDALIAQMFFAQTDQGNIRYWREQSDEGRWHWLVYDLDWCFWPSHLHHNTLASMTNPAGTGYNNAVSTTLTVNLLRNEEFKKEFIERFAYHLNNTFTAEKVIARIDELASKIEPEMPRQVERWGGSMERWYREVEHLRNFARQRPAIVTEQIRRKFNLSDQEMTIFGRY
ncbi:MAG: CotH kinase family protein, partial [Bacillota bacterium]|nr:CotH kinase family protein [Bacillota bacterium]